MTTFLISQATPCQQEYGGTDGCFTGTDNESYNYSIELDEDTVRIEDNCSRMIPFDTSDLGALIVVLSKINRYVQAKATIEKELYEEMVSGSSY